MSKINGIDVNVATITMCCKIPNCELNLLNLGKYMRIDDQIIGIKYKYGHLNIFRGMYSTIIYKKSKNKKIEKVNKHLFYNQISIIVNIGSKNINVKLFKNGSLHMTGCKAENDCFKVLQIILDKLQSMNNIADQHIFLSKDENGVLLDFDNIMYSYNDYQIIGYKKENTSNLYVIDKKEYIANTNKHLLIYTKMETQRKKNILNLNGKDIGYSQIELVNNRTKLYKKHFDIHYDYSSNLIYSNNAIIGKINYYIDHNAVIEPEKYPDIFEINYQVTGYKTKSWDTLSIDVSTYKEMFDVNINCMNVYFNLQYRINRTKLFDILTCKNYLCKYKPEAYSGIKFIYKVPITTSHVELDGVCHCTCKCFCRSITFLIFQSGNVIATGFKCTDEVDIIVSKMLVLMKEFETFIKQKQN